MRMVFGCIAAVLTVALLVAVTFFLGTSDPYPRSSLALTGAAAAGIFALAGVVLWGLPIHYFLSRANNGKVYWYALAGFVPGPIFVTSLKPFGQDPVPYLLLQSAYFGFVGVVGALAFWAIVVGGRTTVDGEP